ncbi:MAG: hypothetical protein ACYTHJ_01030 [Planctomycetota bacterium]
MPRQLRATKVLALMACTTALAGCNLTAPGTAGNGATGTGTGDDNALNSEALSFEGSLSGKLVDTQTTRETSDDSSAAQEAPPRFDTTNTCVRFKDLAGNDLVDPNGEPIPETEVGADGSFDGENLPVGTDFTVCGDIGKDGSCEMESCVNIPADEDGTTGTLSGVQADPLTTLILAKLRELIDERGIAVDDLPVSPATIVTRIVSAYTNLFDEAGIDDEIRLETLLERAAELAALFDELVPEGAQTGMHIVEGNLDASLANDAESLALAVAEVFLRAGFPIVDFPNGVDLSPLGDIDGITTTTKAELFGEFSEEHEDFVGVADLGDPLDELPPDVQEEIDLLFPDGLPEDILDEEGNLNLEAVSDLPPELIATLEDLALESGLSLAQAVDEDMIYISEFAEPDRNHGDDELGGMGIPPLPVISDFILFEMAILHLDNRVIKLNDLYKLLTDLNEGLGLRLTFFVHDPHFVGPPLTVFQTADGEGLAIDVDLLFERIFDVEAQQTDPEDFDAFAASVRGVLADVLGDTVPPSFDRLFDGIAIGRVAGIDAVANHLRDARAHVPFNRTGESSLFVVADSDGFFDSSIGSAITVDADIDREGRVLQVNYNATGNGAFWLGFTYGTESEGMVELILRENGRRVHGQRGPVMVSMFNQAVFQPIDNAPFADFVSDMGSFFSAVPVAVIKDEFAPDGGTDGSSVTLEVHDQVWVLSTHPGEDAQPVHVDYDLTTATATFNPFGRYTLQFMEDSHETGIFILFNEFTGRPATVDDPEEFFGDTVQATDDFVDLFNEFNDEDGFDDSQVVDDFIDTISPEECDPAFEDCAPIDEPCDPSIEVCDPNSTDPTDPPPDGGDSTDPPAPREIFSADGLILVDVAEIAGLLVESEQFDRVFGTEVPNPRYRAEGDPFYDDVNNNGVQDAGEPTSPIRPTLFYTDDWRSTDIRLYYRLADGSSVTFDNVDWESPSPRTLDGQDLVRRNYNARMNAFRFGRPNTAINMLTAFLPASFFNGTNAFDGETEVDIFSAIAIINMVMDQVFNVEGDVDVDGFGPLPRSQTLIDAHPFVVPVDDPFVLLLRGFESMTTVRTDVTDGTDGTVVTDGNL